MKGNEWVAKYQNEVKNNEAEKFGSNQHRVSDRKESECCACHMYGGSRITMHSMKEDVKKKVPPIRQPKRNFDSQPQPHEKNHSGSPTAQK